MLTKNQLARRRSGIGSSDIAAIMGLNKYRTPLDVWEEKTGRSEPEDLSGKIEVAAGNALEETVAQFYAREYDCAVLPLPEEFAQGEAPFLCNIDRVATPPGTGAEAPPEFLAALAAGRMPEDATIVECKVSFGGEPWDEPPEHYQAQALWQRGVFPHTSGAAVAALFLGHSRGFKAYPLPDDREAVAAMRAYAADWWKKFVEGDTPPPAITEEDAKKLWTRPDALPERMATPRQEALVAAYRRASEAEADAAKLKEEARASLIPTLGRQCALFFGGKKICSYSQNKDSVSVKEDWRAGIAETLADALAGNPPAEVRAALEAFAASVKPASEEIVKPGAFVLRLAK
jgi:putative phage-type endonuclease